jgi:hypothetical protein
MKQNKRAAIELSIGTIVVIVLAMSMLILGLVLVRTIFTGATESVNILDTKVQGEIVKLFSDTGTDVIIKLGSDQTAKIKPGGDTLSVGIGARTRDGTATDRNRLKYKLTLDPASGTNCVSVLGKSATEALFITPLNQQRTFDAFDGANAFAGVSIKVPKGTGVCSQTVLVDVTDTKTNTAVGGNYFTIEVLKEGLF